MKEFKITYQQYAKSGQWFNWLAIGAACFYLIIAGVQYNSVNTDSYEWIMNLVFAILWIIIGLHRVFGTTYQYPDVTISDDGISYTKKKGIKLFKWEYIYHIHIDNHSITLHTEKDTTQEINIAYLQYKELQMVKEKLKTFAQSHNVDYASKF